MTTNTTKIRMGLNGANGRMCRAIAHTVKCNPCFQIAFGVDSKTALENNDYPVFKSFQDVPTCDVIVDFSTPSATAYALDYAIAHKVPILVATTGHNEAQRQRIAEAGKSIPVFFASNVSFGTFLLLKLASVAAAFLDDTYDIEIVETHHRIKSDAPSGTALAIASSICAAKEQSCKATYSSTCGHTYRREEHQIGIHSVRGGTVVGKHEVLFLGDDERISITHEAENKSVFVHGALKAAAFLLTQPAGVYSMDDLLKG